MFLFISPNHPYASAISVAFFVFSFWGVGFSPSLPKDLLQHIPNLGRISMGPLLIDPLHLVVPTLLLLFYSCYALLSAAMAGAAGEAAGEAVELAVAVAVGTTDHDLPPGAGRSGCVRGGQ